MRMGGKVGGNFGVLSRYNMQNIKVNFFKG